jgi:hypothetical protein
MKEAEVVLPLRLRLVLSGVTNWYRTELGKRIF